MSEVRSLDRDLTHVDCNHQELGDVVVALPGPPRGWDDDAVDVAIISGVEQTGCSAEDVDGEVMPPQQPVGAEAGDLLAGVTLDVLRERDFEPPPRLTLEVDWGYLFSSEPSTGVEERRGQI